MPKYKNANYLCNFKSQTHLLISESDDELKQYLGNIFNKYILMQIREFLGDYFIYPNDHLYESPFENNFINYEELNNKIDDNDFILNENIHEITYYNKNI